MHYRLPRLPRSNQLPHLIAFEHELPAVVGIKQLDQITITVAIPSTRQPDIVYKVPFATAAPIALTWHPFREAFEDFPSDLIDGHHLGDIKT